jgi:lipopolysaccharide/colanic/teichoic acid biosynthesis glycosyltransferase
MGAMTEFFSGALPSFLPYSATASRVRRADAAAAIRGRVRHHHRGRPHVIDETLFRDALTKERRRAERFDQPFMVILVSASPDTVAGPSVWQPVVEAFAGLTRDTDVLGWFDRGATLGVIVPEVGKDVSVRRKLYKTLRRALTRRLASEGILDCFSVRLHVHDGAAAIGSCPTDFPEELQRRAAGTPIREALKRALDIAGSTALMLMLLPVYAVVAALVRFTSTGPVFFSQDRVGRLGRSFKMLKFRTMYVNSDSAIHQKYVTEFITSNQADKGGVFKIVNDPRITPIGRFLRKTSLDELPQFWNVLRGEMSLVGPRPPLAYEVQQYKPWHRRRVLEAKPGITGLWQVTGRSRTTFDDMVRLDLRYARTCSVWTDVKILLATPRAVISGKGAC